MDYLSGTSDCFGTSCVNGNVVLCVLFSVGDFCVSRLPRDDNDKFLAITRTASRTVSSAARSAVGRGLSLYVYG
jgi:hypothetical protein